MNLIKLVGYLFLSRSVSKISHHLLVVRHEAAEYVEQRGTLIRSNLMMDINRIVVSLLGYMMVMIGIILSAIVGLMWLFVSVWENPHRNIILGISMLIPFLVSVIIFFFIYRSWRKNPFMQDSINAIAEDWQLFRHPLDGNAETTEEPKSL